MNSLLIMIGNDLRISLYYACTILCLHVYVYRSLKATLMSDRKKTTTNKHWTKGKFIKTSIVFNSESHLA